MKEKLSFEQAMDRLEEIVAALENGQAPLDEMMKLYEEGAKLTGMCAAKPVSYTHLSCFFLLYFRKYELKRKKEEISVQTNALYLQLPLKIDIIGLNFYEK